MCGRVGGRENRHLLCPGLAQIMQQHPDSRVDAYLFDTVKNFGMASNRRDAAKVVDNALRNVGLSLDEVRQRYPHELSGGQQQRVAIARSLAPEPALLLLDEPFSSLDAGLRKQLRAQLRDLLKQLGSTAILVTHDQEEAMAFADRVAVMRQGLIEQYDTPWQVYHQPASPYVAGFVGEGALIRAERRGDGWHKPHRRFHRG